MESRQLVSVLAVIAIANIAIAAALWLSLLGVAPLLNRPPSATETSAETLDVPAADTVDVPVAETTVEPVVVETVVTETERGIAGYGSAEVRIDLDPGIWAIRRVSPSGARVSLETVAVRGNWSRPVQIVAVSSDYQGFYQHQQDIDLAVPPGPALVSVETDGRWVITITPATVGRG